MNYEIDFFLEDNYMHAYDTYGVASPYQYNFYRCYDEMDNLLKSNDGYKYNREHAIKQLKYTYINNLEIIRNSLDGYRTIQEVFEEAAQIHDMTLEDKIRYNFTCFGKSKKLVECLLYNITNKNFTGKRSFNVSGYIKNLDYLYPNKRKVYLVFNLTFGDVRLACMTQIDNFVEKIQENDFILTTLNITDEVYNGRHLLVSGPIVKCREEDTNVTFL